MKPRIITMALFAGCFLLTVACKDDDENENPEFVATSASFNGFRSWTLETELQGPSASLGEAHQGNNSSATRTVYFKDDRNRGSDGRFPVGTLVVKDTRDASDNTIEVTAMVKRGNNFNPDHNDWEWFVLNADGTIKMDGSTALRGARLMDGMCGACHTQAKNDDFIFSK